jgi:hypothetical protein
MPDLTIIYWRDIPAQVMAKQGRQRTRHRLSDRFQHGIDRAAMRAKKLSADAYLDDWHRETTKLIGEMDALVQETALRLESEYDDLRLERIVKNKGLEPDAVKVES